MLVAALGLGVCLTGCGGTVETGKFTILDSGSGPQLCEAVMESYPPQCNGAPIVDWDWDAVPHEHVSGVRRGEYTVSLRHEGDAVHVTLIDPAASELP